MYKAIKETGRGGLNRMERNGTERNRWVPRGEGKGKERKEKKRKEGKTGKTDTRGVNRREKGRSGNYKVKDML